MEIKTTLHKVILEVYVNAVTPLHAERLLLKFLTVKEVLAVTPHKTEVIPS